MPVPSRKFTMRKTGTRGRPGKNPPRATKKAAHRSASTPAIKEMQTPAPRKPRQPAGFGRAGSGRRQLNSVLAAQLETISNELQSIAGLRREIEELRARIDVLNEAVDALIKANHGRAIFAEKEPQPAPQDAETEPRQTEDMGVL
jgi:hypothetical protein